MPYKQTTQRRKAEIHYGIGHLIMKLLCCDPAADERYESKRANREGYYGREDRRNRGKSGWKKGKKPKEYEYSKSRAKRHDAIFRPENRHPAMTAVTYMAGNRGPPTSGGRYKSKRVMAERKERRRQARAEARGEGGDGDGDDEE